MEQQYKGQIRQKALVQPEMPLLWAVSVYANTPCLPRIFWMLRVPRVLRVPHAEKNSSWSRQVLYAFVFFFSYCQIR